MKTLSWLIPAIIAGVLFLRVFWLVAYSRFYHDDGTPKRGKRRK